MLRMLLKFFRTINNADIDSQKKDKSRVRKLIRLCSLIEIEPKFFNIMSYCLFIDSFSLATDLLE